MPQSIVTGFAVILFLLLVKPIALVNVYFFGRPLVQVFGVENLTLLSLPINWPFAAIVVLSVFPLGLFRKNFRYFPQNTVAIYLLVVLSVLSAAFSIDLSASVAQTVKYLNALALVLLVSNAVTTRKDIVRIYQGLAISSIIPMGYGYYQLVTNTGVPGGLIGETSRIMSFFGFPNMYGIFLSLIIFAISILYLDSNNRGLKILYGIVLTSAVASSIAALNRGSWIAIVSGLMFAFPFYRKHISVKWVVIIVSVLALVAAGVMVERFMELQEDRMGADTFGARIAMWSLIANNFSETPVLGYGTGAAQLVMNNLFDMDTIPHNDYLRLLLEVGLFGPLVYLLLLVKEVLWNLRVRRHDAAWHVNYFTLAMIVYMIIISSVQNVVHNVVVFPMFLVCCHLAKRYVMLLEEP